MTIRQTPTWASQMEKEEKIKELRSCADLNTVDHLAHDEELWETEEELQCSHKLKVYPTQHTNAPGHHYFFVTSLLIIFKPIGAFIMRVSVAIIQPQF